MKLALRIVVLGLALLVAGCGERESGGGDPGATSPASQSAPPEQVCDRFVDEDGSDDAQGSAEDPFRSFQEMADSLESGQTGCLREGTHDQDSRIEVTVEDVTFRSVPGEVARLEGRLLINADGVTVEQLELVGPESGTATSPAVTAEDVTFQDNDVTNNHEGGICFGLGSDEGFGRAIETVIRRNRIHDCGRQPSTNLDHGIYVAHADDVLIEDNLIFSNTDRGVQLYPDAQGTIVQGNVIWENGSGVIFSGEGEESSDDNLVTGNIIGRSVLRWNIESGSGAAVEAEGNLVEGNCLFSANEDDYYNENGGVMLAGERFTAEDNLIADPGFGDPDEGGFELGEDSPCAGVIPPHAPVFSAGVDR